MKLSKAKNFLHVSNRGLKELKHELTLFADEWIDAYNFLYHDKYGAGIEREFVKALIKLLKRFYDIKN